MDSRSTAERRWSVAIAHVGGIAIRVHVTFLALLVLVGWAAADAGLSVVAEVGWILTLFACVVGHELAHSVVARAKGIAVHEIDLLPIGGVSRLERIPEDWRTESAIAVAGPLASVAIAVLAFLLASIGRSALLPPSLAGGSWLARLGWVNLMLAAFNLVPAFPLDGGRVLRALLERNRSRLLATRQAALVSRWLAMAMIAVGVAANVWLIFIGMFVMVAGRAEEAAVLLHETGQDLHEVER